MGSSTPYFYSPLINRRLCKIAHRKADSVDRPAAARGVPELIRAGGKMSGRLTSRPLTKVAYRSHINIGENSDDSTMWLDLQPWLPLLTISLTITLCFLAGIALGLRYKVWILVPAVTLAMIFAMIIGVARADHFWSIVLAMVVLGTAVQFGYLAGIEIRAAVGSVIPLPHAQVAQRHAP